jgi:hypothetical protein
MRERMPGSGRIDVHWMPSLLLTLPKNNQLGKFDRTGVLDALFSSLTLRVFTTNEPHLQPLRDADNAVLTYRCYEEMTAGEKEIKGGSYGYSTLPEK